MLNIKNISKSYGATKALRDCSFSVGSGEVHVLIGANGSGKSTVCKIISGSVQADFGHVEMNSRPLTIQSPQCALQAGISIFYQELSLAENRTITENIFLAHPPRQYGLFIDEDKIKRDSMALLSLFEEILDDDFDLSLPVKQLREDQKQIVEIMKVIAIDAPVMIFDEPTSSLDKKQVQCFFSIIRKLKQQGKSIIFISHRMDEIFDIGDRVTVLRDGEIVDTVDIKGINVNDLVNMMIGTTKGSEKIVQKRDVSSQDKIICLQSFSGVKFHNVNIDVASGEIVGLGGLHGQGQSNLLRTIFGASAVSDGMVSIAGKNYRQLNPRDAIVNKIAYISGDRLRDGIYGQRSIFENIIPIFSILQRKLWVNSKVPPACIIETLSDLKTLYSDINQEITNLSGGNQQKVVIGRWLVECGTERPKVLLLDDPTKGIDSMAKKDLFAMITKMSELGMSIILYSSDDDELLTYSDRIFVFNNGHITRELKGVEKTSFNLYKAAYEGHRDEYIKRYVYGET